MVNHEQSNRFPALAIFLLLSLLGHLWLMMLWTPLPAEPTMPAASSTSVSLSIRAGKKLPAIPEPVPAESLPAAEPVPEPVSAPPESPVTELPADVVEPSEPLTPEIAPAPQTKTEPVVTAMQSEVAISDAEDEQSMESSPSTTPDNVAESHKAETETSTPTVPEALEPDTPSESSTPAVDETTGAATTSSEAEPSDDLVSAKGFSDPTIMPATLTPARYAGPTPRVITPPDALRRRLRGTVVLGGFVDAEGKLNQVRILESSGHELLDEAASEQAPQWQYQPARNGTIVEGQWVRIPVTFR
ncbi:energy transducer TonB [Reinekea blandensis]|uniref:TonB protein n=1 Tax=Reinekea blandensis MED297 TaxID=314283 RepID=A4B9Q2_9GAMM|nr:energy transducer TonB [Reinekea blandensis]EAR11353.1 TonB protein [Reinekea sp. MED297] [Reinekea blandensis MED297]